MIPFGEWLPDQPDFQNPGATEVLNVIPAQSGYRPVPNVATIDSATGAPSTAVKGAFFTETSGGTGYMYAGTETKLHRYAVASSPAAWSEVTRTVGGGYTNANVWRFVKFGSRVIAVNGADAPQSYVEGSSTDFDALAGSPPSAARYVSVVRDFVNMAPVGNTQYWSAINDPTDWTPSATTQSDTQDIPEGIITGLAGGEVGLTFTKNAIYRQRYVGSPLIFQFDKITSNLGMASDGSLAQYENIAFFHSGEGFYMIVDGQQIIPIGEDKVDRFYDEDASTTLHDPISACIDTVRKLYCCHYVNNDSPVKYVVLFYHWPTQRWSRVEFSALDIIVQSKTFPVALGDLQGLTLTAFVSVNSVSRHHSFSGSNLAATLETTEAQIFPGRRAFVRGIRPIVDGGTDANITVAVAARAAPNDTVTFGSAVAMNSNGLSPQRSSGRFHRARVSIAAGASWTHAQGIDVDAVPEGTR